MAICMVSDMATQFRLAQDHRNETIALHGEWLGTSTVHTFVCSGTEMLHVYLAVIV